MPLEVFQGKFIKIFSGAIEEKGQKLTLRMTDKSDLTRDILTVNIFSDFFVLYIEVVWYLFIISMQLLCSFHTKHLIYLLLIFCVTSTQVVNVSPRTIIWLLTVSYQIFAQSN